MTTRVIMHLAACAAVLCGFPAVAATVVPYAGDVFVNQGNGFQRIGGATMAKVGDSVMVSPNGLAQVDLDDGNAVTVSPGQVFSVPAKARAQDAALPGGANPTQANSDDISGLIGAAAMMAGAAAVATALATSGGGGAPVVALRPASP